MQRQPAEEEGADGLIWEGEGFDSEFDGDLEEEREGLGAYDFVQEPQEEPGAPGRCRSSAPFAC